MGYAFFIPWHHDLVNQWYADMEDIGKQIAIRLPFDLYDAVKRAANADGRTVSDEIRRRLQGSLAGEIKTGDDPVFAPTLEAIGHAAAGAAKMSADPLLAYKAFMAAALVLMSLFLPERREVSKEELTRTVSAVFGFVVAQMGDRLPPGYALSDLETRIVEVR